MNAFFSALAAPILTVLYVKCLVADRDDVEVPRWTAIVLAVVAWAGVASTVLGGGAP